MVEIFVVILNTLLHKQYNNYYYIPLIADWRFWYVERFRGQQLLHHPRREDSCEMDRPRGMALKPRRCRQFQGFHSNLYHTSCYICSLLLFGIHRPSTLGSTPLLVMCGALVVSCMRYGVSDTNHLKPIPIFRYVIIIFMHPHTI